MHRTTYTIQDLERLHAIEARARILLSIWRSGVRPGQYRRWLDEMSEAESALAEALEEGEDE